MRRNVSGRMPRLVLFLVAVVAQWAIASASDVTQLPEVASAAAVQSLEGSRNADLEAVRLLRGGLFAKVTDDIARHEAQLLPSSGRENAAAQLAETSDGQNTLWALSEAQNNTKMINKDIAALQGNNTGSAETAKSIAEIEKEAEETVNAIVEKPDANNTGGGETEAEKLAKQAENEAQSEAQTKLQECELKLPGLTNATVFIESHLRTCEANFSTANATKDAVLAQAKLKEEARQTAVEELKSQFNQEKRTERLLQEEQSEYVQTKRQCDLKLAHTRGHNKAQVEQWSQLTNEHHSTLQITQTQAMSAARSEATALAHSEAEKVVQARAVALELSTEAQTSARQAIHARKTELSSVLQAQLEDIREEAKFNRTKAYDTAKAAVAEIRSMRDSKVSIISSAAFNARESLMKMQHRLNMAHKLKEDATQALTSLSGKSKAYRQWATANIAKLNKVIETAEAKEAAVLKAAQDEKTAAEAEKAELDKEVGHSVTPSGPAPESPPQEDPEEDNDDTNDDTNDDKDEEEETPQL